MLNELAHESNCPNSYDQLAELFKNNIKIEKKLFSPTSDSQTCRNVLPTQRRMDMMIHFERCVLTIVDVWPIFF